MQSLFRWFESLILPTGPVADADPPAGVLAFFWHFARQSKGVLFALLLAGLFTAGFDLLIPIFIGRIAGLVATHPRATLLQETGPALRDVLVVGVDAVWYIVLYGVSLLYGVSAILLLGATDWRLAVPIVCWFVLYAALLWVMVPRLRVRSRRNSEARSLLTGRVVDSYTNILTVKLFARADEEDGFVREAIEEHTAAFQAQTRAITAMTVTLSLINALLLAGTAEWVVSRRLGHAHVQTTLDIYGWVREDEALRAAASWKTYANSWRVSDDQ